MGVSRILLLVFLCCATVSPSSSMDIYELPSVDSFEDENLMPVDELLLRRRRDTDNTVFSGDGETTETSSDTTSLPSSTSLDVTSSISLPTLSSVDATSSIFLPSSTSLDVTSSIFLPSSTSVDATSSAFLPSSTSLQTSASSVSDGETTETSSDTTSLPSSTSLDVTSSISLPSLSSVDATSSIFLPSSTSLDVTSSIFLPSSTSVDATSSAFLPSSTSLQTSASSVSGGETTVVSLHQKRIHYDDTTTETLTETTATPSTLTTTQPPFLISGLCNNTVGGYVEGDKNISILCLFAVIPPRSLSITWYRGGGAITGSSRVTINTTDHGMGQYSTELFFKTVYSRDKGNYTSIASADGVTKEVEVVLTVYEKPVVSLSPSVLSLQGDQRQNFTCVITNHRMVEEVPASLKWCRGDEVLPNRSSIVQVGPGREVLMMSSSDDAGSYSCGVDICTETAKFVKYTAQDKTCGEGKDDSNTTWPQTVSDNNITLPCQTGFVGTVTRYCNADGVWGTSDYINCINEKIAEVEDTVKAIEEGTASVEEVKAVLTTLADVTGNTVTSSSGDLDKSIEVVGELVKVVTNTSPTEFPIELNTAQSFLDVVGNILSVDTSDHGQWYQVQAKNPNKAASLMRSVTGFGLAAAKSQQENTPLEISNDNLVMEIGNNVQGDILFPSEAKSEELDTLKLPGSNFQSNEKVMYVAVLYNTMDEFLPKNSSGGEVNSKILALSITNDGKDVNRLYDNITLNFGHSQTNYSEPACGFWDFKDSSLKTDGCTAKEINESFSECTCDHLTNFAILMKPGRTIIPEEGLTFMKIITIVGCSLSILGCALTIFVHSCLWRYVKSPTSAILISMCISLLCAYVVFLAGVERTENKDACTAVAALLHYFFLTAFFLMLAQGIEIAIQAILTVTIGSKLTILLPLAWGLPAIIVAITLGVTKLEGYGSLSYCWLTLTDGIIYYAFVGPVLFVILVNVIIIIVVMRALSSSKVVNSKLNTQKAVAGVRSLCVLMPVLGVTCVFGVLSVNMETIVIKCLFAGFSAVQGFVIFIFHVLLNRSIQDGFRKRKYRFNSEKLTKTSSFSRSVKITRQSENKLQMAELDCDYSESNDSFGLSEGFEMTSHQPISWQNQAGDMDNQRLSYLRVKNEDRARAMNNEYVSMYNKDFDLAYSSPGSWHEQLADNYVTQRLPRASIKKDEPKANPQIYRGRSSSAEGPRWSESEESPVERRVHSNGIYRDVDGDGNTWNNPVFKTHL